MLLFLFVSALSVRAQDLKDRLLSDDPGVRMKALAAVRGLDDGAKAQLVPYFAGKVRDSGRMTRSYASQALGQVGAPALPELLKLLRDPDTDLRYLASQALGMVGEPALPALVAVLREPDNDVRCNAARALGQMSATAQPAIPALAPLSKDPDAKLRSCVAEVLGRIGGPGALKVLVPLLSDSDRDVRWATLNALNPFGSSAREAVPMVMALAKDDDSVTRGVAYRTLGKIGAGNSKVVEMLRWAVRNDKSWIAIYALGELGPDAASAVPDLVVALKSTTGHYPRGTIALSLGNIGPAAKDAVPALMQLWVDAEPYSRTQAIEAVSKIGPVAIPALIAGLKDKNADIRSGAAWQLGEFHGKAASAVPELISLLRDEEATVRMNTAQALAKIGTPEAMAAASRVSGGQINPWTVHGKRLWTKAEIAAPIPPSEGQRDARKLDSEVRIPAPGVAVLLATIHRGDGNPDHLAVWGPVGDRYEPLALEGWDESEENRSDGVLAPPGAFGHGNERFIHLELRIPGTAFLHEDTFFWIAPDLTLHKVGFQAAPEGYLNQLKKGEGIWKGEMNKFTNDKMEFEFFIWNEGDGNCCPTAGHVKGEYKLVGERKFDPARKTWSADFRIVPATYTRMAIEKQ